MNTLIEVASNLKPADFELLFSKIYMNPEPEVENEPTDFYQTATRYVNYYREDFVPVAGCWLLVFVLAVNLVRPLDNTGNP